MENNVESRRIEIEQESLNHLNTTRKWAMFIAIIGFIFLGLIIIIGMIAGTFLSAFSSTSTTPEIPGYLMSAIVLVLAVVYFFPIFFLFRFSKHTAHAVKTLNKMDLYKAIKNLKSYFVYIGILIIIVLSIYIGLLVVAGSSMAFLRGLG
jgi:hypothetical protein